MKEGEDMKLDKCCIACAILSSLFSVGRKEPDLHFENIGRRGLGLRGI